MLDLLQFWASPFHCMQLIVNRETLNHRDTRGWMFGYDLLTTFGDYNNGVLSLPTIGIECEYNPGTVTALMGKLIIHGVKPVNGERFCFASLSIKEEKGMIGLDIKLRVLRSRLFLTGSRL